MQRICSEHGPSESVLASDARFYWLSQGASATIENEATTENRVSACQSASRDGCAGTMGSNAGNPGHIEKLATCLALIEIVDSCNLACPTCFADSPAGVGSKVKARPLAELQDRINGVIARKGRLEILQLSGGEPTLHPEFFELVRWAQEHPHIDMLLINTNGVRIAQDDEFFDGCATMAARKGIQLYLQYDGPQLAGQRDLRGADLRALRSRVLNRCGEIGLPVTLAMTVIPENLPHVWEAIQVGLAFPHVHGITFQPMFGSGRVPLRVPSRVTAADIVISAMTASEGKLSAADFTPLPCGDPNCAIIGYLLRVGSEVRSISDFVDFTKLQGFLHDRVNYRIDDLAHCGCESDPLGQLLHGIEMQAPVGFRIMIKPFMDSETWDQDRIDRCCTHVIRPDGSLDSFCRYYGASPDGAAYAQSIESEKFLISEMI
jgi:uncharacterized radical SAM superfamily Fe-S cluster-containing enzyme